MPLIKPKFWVMHYVTRTYVPAKNAEEIKLKGFEEFSFVRHYKLDGIGYTISERSTGFYIAHGKNKPLVVKNTLRELNKRGKSAVTEAIHRQLNHPTVIEALKNRKGWR